MLGGHLLADGQAESQAVITPGLRLVLLIEGLEDPVEVIRSNADTSVLHRDGDILLLIVHLCRDADVPDVCELQGIRHEVVHELRAAMGIRLDDGKLRAGHSIDEPHSLLHHWVPAFINGVLAEDHDLLHDGGHLHIVPRETHLFVLHEDRGIHNVTDHVEQPGSATVDHLEWPAHSIIIAGRFCHGAAQTDDAVQGRLELMADHGHEA
mmetsp:Transcript_105154/g.234733  ORF Transcript_105154/g.234733 Transcript_105154/m.234733 type:complete len:209 (+) Transcript_105154:1923-2549(+)